ncbi:MAG TPA: hypothetical protein VF069_05320 [Streptosporangiaceae bacterium]
MAQLELSSITAEADAAIRDLIVSAKQSVADAVSNAAQELSQNLTQHVNDELVEMTARFKETHPAVTQAVTDVVGYADAINTTATAMRESFDQVRETATQLKQLPGTVKDIRTGLRDTATEAGKLGRDIRQFAASSPAAMRSLATAVSRDLSRAFTAAGQGAANASAAFSRFRSSAQGLAGSAAGAVRSLGQLALGYARAAAQAVVAAARTVAMNVAQRAIAVATRLWAVAQGLLNAAMRLNPVGLIITGITLLVGLFVLAYQRSETFRNIVQAVMRGVSTAIGWVVDIAKAVFNWIKANWPLLLAILGGPIGLAVLAIIKHWDAIKAGITAVRNWIVDRWNDVIGFFSGIPDRITAVANRMWEGLKSAARGAINFLIDAWNRLDFGIHVHLPSFIPGIGGKGFDVDDLIPDIPRLAEGGLVPSRAGGVLALLGEGGEDEVVLPLSRLSKAFGTTARPVTVNVHPRPGQSEYEIGRIAAREIAWAAKR